jgi:hypothetical protein
MTRKRCHRQPIAPRLPPGLRPGLRPDQVRDLALVHVINLDMIAKGEATESTLWQWVGGVLTWSRVAGMMHLGEAEMAQQLELCGLVLERYNKSGRVGFSGPEYQLAKIGVAVMDQLAETVDRDTALAAADWSERRVNARSLPERAHA